ncbi:MAG: retention module-containing protein [Burkholderiaceae bacterium]|nr:retention module-containing protein [Burkholderiaceae bacterium]
MATTSLVTQVTGQAWVRGADGTLNPIHQGMQIPADADVVTATGGSVQLQTNGQPPLTIGEGRDVQVGAEVAQANVDPGNAAAAAPADPDVASILAAINDGGDPFAELDPTAAVLTAGAGGDGGSSFTRLSSIIETTNPLGLEYPRPTYGRPEEVRLGGTGSDDDGDQVTTVVPTPTPTPTPTPLPGLPTIDIPSFGGEGLATFDVAEDFTRSPAEAVPQFAMRAMALASDTGNEAQHDFFFTFNSPAGLKSISFTFDGETNPLEGGVTGAGRQTIQVTLDELLELAVSGAPIGVNTDHGFLSLTGFDPSTNRVTYEYWSDGAQDHSGGAVTDTINVTLTDNLNRSVSGKIVANITDTEPVAFDDEAIQTAENAVVTVDVFGNDTEGADGVNLGTGVVLVAGTLSGDGTLLYNADGTFTYTPAAGEEGEVTFEYTITDADGDTATAKATITLLDDSEPTVSVEFDAAGGGGVVSESALPGGSGGGNLTTSGTLSIETGGDTLGKLEVQDKDSNWVTITADGTVVQGVHGTLVVDMDGAWEYTLSGRAEHTDDQATGTDDQIADPFAVRVTDSDSDVSAEVPLIIQINDDGPVACDDKITQKTENAPVTIDVFKNDDGGADGVDLSAGVQVVVGSLSGGGNLVYNENGTFTYMPAAGEEGKVTFKYTITDADGDTATAKATITLKDDSEPTVSVEFDAAGGEGVVWESALPVVGSGGGSLTTSGSLSIQTGGDTLSKLEVQDKDSNWVTIVADGTVVQGVHGTLVVDMDGAWEYTLSGRAEHTDDQATGTDDQIADPFAVRVTDSDSDVSAEVPLIIQINDDGPVACDDKITQKTENAPVTIDVFKNDDGGADGVDLSAGVQVVVGSLSGGGNLVYNENGTFTYMPAAGEEGKVTFKYTITDADGDTATAKATITLKDDSEPTVSVEFDAAGGEGVVWESALPVVGSGGGSLTTSGSLSIQTGGDTLSKLEVQGKDGNWVTITANGTVVQGGHGTLVVDMDGTWTYTLSGRAEHALDDQTGAADQVEDPFKVRVTDSDSDVSAEVPLTIQINDDGPVACDDEATQTAENAVVTVDVFGNDGGGADGVNLSTGVVLVAGTLSGDGTLVYNADGTFTYTPAAGEEGEVTFEYTITDADGDTATAKATITLLDDSEPTVSVEFDAAGGEGVVSESALLGGSGGGNLTTSGTLSIETGGDTLSKLEVQDKDSNWVTIVADGTVVQGVHGTLVVDMDGTWKYTLSGRAEHALDDQTGAADQVEDPFKVRVTDSDSDVSAEVPLTIQINDDGPQEIIAESIRIVNGSDAVSSGELNFFENIGADGGDVVFTVANDSLLKSGDNQITSGGEVVKLYQQDDGHTLIAKTGASPDGTGGKTIFEVKLNPDGSVEADDIYTVQFFEALDDGRQISFDPNNLKFAESGNKSFNVIDGTDNFDILLSTATRTGSSTFSASTVNTSTQGIGAGSNHLNDNQLVRIDFVKNASGGNNYGYSEHYTVNAFTFVTNDAPNNTEVWVRLYNDTTGVGATNKSTALTATGNLVTITAILVDGVEINLSVLRSDGNGGYLIEGLKAGSSVEVRSAAGFDGVEIENVSNQHNIFGDGLSLNGESFRLSVDSYSVASGGAGKELELKFDLLATDADGDTAPGSLTITTTPPLAATVTGTEVAEGESVEFTVALSSAVDGPTTLALQLKPGTGQGGAEWADLWDGTGDLPTTIEVKIGGGEYQSVILKSDGSFSVGLAAGDTEITVKVPTFNDVDMPVFEGPETFTLEVVGTAGTVSKAVGTGTILDNDTPNLTVSNALDVSEGNNAVFDISLGGTSIIEDTIMTLTLKANGGTGEANPADFNGSPTVTIDGVTGPIAVTANGNGSYSFTVPAGTSGGIHVSVPTKVDGSPEGRETFQLEAALSPKAGSSLDFGGEVTDTGSGAIIDYNYINGTPENDNIPGTLSNDIVVADVGKGLEITGGNYNIAFVVDTSYSMGSKGMSDAKASLTTVFNTLAASANTDYAGKVNVFLVDFDTNVRTTVSVDLKAEGALQTLLDAVTSMSYNDRNPGDQYGYTNYEDAFKTTANWFHSDVAKNNTGAENLTYFITDGDPTRYQNNVPINTLVYNDSGTTNDKAFSSLVDLVNYIPGVTTVSHGGRTIVNQDGQVFSWTRSGSSWSSREIGQIKPDGKGGYELSVLAGSGTSATTDSKNQSRDAFALLTKDGLTTVEAIGLGSSVNTNELRNYDSDGQVKNNINPADLAAAILGDGSALAPASDMVDGGAGDDIIFGDQVTFTGLDKGGFDALKDHVAAQPSVSGPVTAEVVHDYITENHASLNQLLGDIDGGDDILRGGAGEDIIFGQGGDDQLYGGDGNDILYGGSGADKLYGGDGNDRLVGGKGNDELTGGAGDDTFAWEAGDQGTSTAPAADTIFDFGLNGINGKADDPNGNDVLDLSSLLQGQNTGTIASLDALLDFRFAGGDTVVSIKSQGASGGVDQTITLKGVNLIAEYELGAGNNDAALIQAMIEDGKLKVDQS